MRTATRFASLILLSLGSSIAAQTPLRAVAVHASSGGGAIAGGVFAAQVSIGIEGTGISSGGAFELTGGLMRRRPPQSDVRATLVDTPDPVAAGGRLTYVATVLNDGPGVATDVSLSLPLPPRTTLVAGSANENGACSSGAVVVCAWAGPVPPGATRIASIVVTVAATSSGSLSATATAAANNDGQSSNNTASAITHVSRRGVPSG